jgi:hypothetical protein
VGPCRPLGSAAANMGSEPNESLENILATFRMGWLSPTPSLPSQECKCISCVPRLRILLARLGLTGSLVLAAWGQVAEEH